MIIRLVSLILALGSSAVAHAATELPSDTRLIFQANVRPILLAFKDETEDTIFLTGLDQADQLVQGAVDLEIASGTNPCFMPLPDGRILLAYDSTLRAVAPDGSIEDVTPEFSFEAITGLTLGPQGEVIMATADEIILFDLDSGTSLNRYDIDGAQAPTLLPNNRLAVAVGDTMSVLDLATGTIVDELMFHASVTGIARGADGTIAVTTPDDVIALGTDLEETTRLAFADGTNPCFLPNGLLEVLDSSAGTLFQIDLAASSPVALTTASSTPTPGFTDPGLKAVTVMPHRFEVDLSTMSLISDGGAEPVLEKVTETAKVSLLPGSGKQIIRFDQESSKLAATIGTKQLVVTGFEGKESKLATDRLFQGTQGSGDKQSAFGAEAKGSLQTKDYYALDSFKGSFQFSGAKSAVLGTVDSKKLLNP